MIGMGSRELDYALDRWLTTPPDEGESKCKCSECQADMYPGEKIYVLECNIDDSTGEMLGFAMEELFTAGAKDVIYLPCFMKKNRPAVLLKVIAAENDLPEIEKTIFRCTTTIGLRKYPVERVCMERKSIKVKTSVGEIDVKRCSFDEIVRYYPEFESVKQAAKKSVCAIQEIYEEAALAAKEQDV